jgi:hypothetical protein
MVYLFDNREVNKAYSKAINEIEYDSEALGLFTQGWSAAINWARKHVDAISKMKEAETPKPDPKVGIEWIPRVTYTFPSCSTYKVGDKISFNGKTIIITGVYEGKDADA